MSEKQRNARIILLDEAKNILFHGPGDVDYSHYSGKKLEVKIDEALFTQKDISLHAFYKGQQIISDKLWIRATYGSWPMTFLETGNLPNIEMIGTIESAVPLPKLPRPPKAPEVPTFDELPSGVVSGTSWSEFLASGMSYDKWLEKQKKQVADYPAKLDKFNQTVRDRQYAQAVREELGLTS